PGAGDAAGDGRRRLLARRGGPAAPRDGGVEEKGRPRALRGKTEARHAAQRLYDRVRRFDLPPDPRVRRLWLPRIAFGQLRAARVFLGLAQMSSPGAVPGRAAQ